MQFRAGIVAGLKARLFRVSFTGELSYEIHVPADRAETLWRHLMDAGAREGITAIGIDAWMLLRTEKGYLHVGADTDGTTAPGDIGFGHVLERTGDFVGRRSLTRPENLRGDRLQFVGLEAEESSVVLPVGAQAANGHGYVTSAGYSPVLDRGVALGMIRAGQTRHGEVLDFTDGARSWRARVTPPGAYDREGTRLHG